MANLRDTSVENAKLLADFVDSHRREPSTTGKAKGERHIARWLVNQRSYFKRTGKVSVDAEDTLAKRGFGGMLRKSKQESSSNMKTRLLCNWITMEGRFPDHQSEDPSEKYIGSFFFGSNQGTVQQECST